MRKERAAARRFPFQRRKIVGLDREYDKAAFVRKVLCQRTWQLFRSRKVNIAVGNVYRSTKAASLVLEGLELNGAEYLVSQHAGFMRCTQSGVKREPFLT